MIFKNIYGPNLAPKSYDLTEVEFTQHEDASIPVKQHDFAVLEKVSVTNSTIRTCNERSYHNRSIYKMSKRYLMSSGDIE